MLGIACAILWASFIISFITCCFFYSCTKIQAPLIALASMLLRLCLRLSAGPPPLLASPARLLVLACWPAILFAEPP